MRTITGLRYLSIIFLSIDGGLPISNHALAMMQSSVTAQKQPSIRFIPTEIEFAQVSKHYPLTWQHRFLSSVPLRDFALRNLTLHLESHQLVIIEGASSSGKSTLLKAILEPEQVTAGCVKRSLLRADDDPQQIMAMGQPIYLYQRPPLDRRSIRQLLADDRSKLMRNHEADNSTLRYVTEQRYLDLTNKLAGILGFANGNKSPSCKQRPLVSDMTPSETYRLAILRACIVSCSTGSPLDVAKDCVPAPILLLDEWLDTETSTVVQAVQKSLAQLVARTGAIVCVVTHKRERWKPDWVNRTVTLCRGEILTTTM